MLSMRWNRFQVCSACDEITSPYAQCAIKFVPRMLSMDCTCKKVHILPLAEHARKFVPRMLSMWWNRFRVCSACDKIVSVHAQHTHAIIFEKYLKNQIKMQILTINNRNFQKPSRKPSNRTKLKILKKKIFWIAHQKNLVPRMLSHRGNVRTSKFWRNRRKRSEIFFENLRRAYKDLI